MSKLYAILLLVFLSPILDLYAQQAPDWLWAKSIGGINNNSAVVRRVHNDKIGDVYITGQFTSTVDFGGTTLTSAGNNDTFMAKYAPDGTLIWAKRIGSTQYDMGWGIATDDNDNVYFSSEFKGTATYAGGTLTSSGNNDIAILKYNSTGTLIWARKIGGSGEERNTNLAVNPSGTNYYITGGFRGSVNFGGTTLSSSGNSDIFVTKYTDAGTLVWAKKAGGSIYDEGLGIGLDSLENVYISGLIQGTVNFDGTSISSAGGNDVFIAKYNSSGTIQWVRRAGGSSNDESRYMVTDKAGNSYFTGYFRGTATFGPLNVTGASIDNYYLAKYNSSGTVQWVRTAQGSTNSYGFGVDVDQVGNIYATGFFAGTADFSDAGGNNFSLTSAGDRDAFIAKYNNSGTVQWAKGMSGSNYEDARGVAVFDDNTIYASGYIINSTTSFGNIQLPLVSNGTFLARLGSLVTTLNDTTCEDVPYLFGNQSLNSPGTYTDTLTSSTGTDSIVVLNLTILPIANTFIAATICANQPYFFNGQNLTTSGIYEDTLIAANGCDSLVALNLIVKPVPYNLSTVSICPSGLPYNFNGQLLTASGLYEDTLTAANGCDSINAINLIVKPNATTVLNVAACPSDLPYNFNGQSINTAGNYQSILSAANGCDSLVTLNFTVDPSSVTILNDTVCSNDLPYNFVSQSLTASGVYIDTLPNRFGCDSIITLDLIVNPTSATVLADTVCDNALPYNFVSQSLTASGVYVDTLPNRFGCDSIITLDLTVNPTSATALVDTVCSDVLPYSFVSQSLTASGIYVDTLTNRLGCDSIITLDFTVLPLSFTVINDTICADAAPYLFAGLTLSQSGTFYDTLTAANGCDSLVTLNLIVNPLPPVAVLGANRVCPGEGNVAYSLAPLPVSTVTTTWQVNGGNLLGSSTDSTAFITWGPTNPAATLSFAAINTLTGCQSSGNYTVRVNVELIPEIALPADTFCSNEGLKTYFTQFTTPGSVYAWFVEGGQIVSTLDNSVTINWNYPTGTDTTASGAIWVTESSITTTDTCFGTSDTMQVTLAATPPITFLTDTVCSDALPYNFVSQLLTSSGIYVDTLPNRFGCDSIITLDLTVNPTSVTALVDTVCSDVLPYNFVSQSLTSSGVYVDTLPNRFGCDSIITLDLTVNPISATALAVIICNDALPYNFVSQSLTASGVYVDTLPNRFGCDSIITLDLTVNPTSATALVDTVCSDVLPYNFVSQSLTASGVYVDTLPNRFGCDSIITLDLTVNPTSATALVDTVCSDVLPYNFVSQSLTTSGVYVDTLPNRFGCDSIITLDLIVNPTSATVLADTVCSNALPYNFVSQSLTASGVYVDTLPNRFGCDSIITLDLTVNPTSATALVDTVCSDVLPYNFVSQSLTASGVYVDTLPNRFGCDSIITLDFTVNPTAATALVDTVCNDALPYNFLGQSLTASGVYVDTLPNRFGCDSIITLDLIVNPISATALVDTVCSDALPYNFVSQLLTSSGVYVDTLPNRFGCDSIITLDLSILPVAFDTLSATICSNEFYSYNNQNLNVAGFYEDTLTAPNGCNLYRTLDLRVLPANYELLQDTIVSSLLPYAFGSRNLPLPGTYVDSLTNLFGCDSVVVLNLLVLEDFTIPNVITPNNDGLNDFFVLPGLSFFAPVSIKIYNRWGKEVYNQSDYQNDWQASNLPAGTYFINLTTRQGYVYKSWVQVMK